MFFRPTFAAMSPRPLYASPRHQPQHSSLVLKVLCLMMLAVPAFAVSFSATFGGVAVGTVALTQSTPSDPTTIAVALNSTKPISTWTVLAFPSSTGSCATSGALFNPSAVSLGSCTLGSESSTCAVGDLEAKLGALGNVSLIAQNFSDPYLPLFAAERVEGRALQLRFDDGTTLCATIGSEQSCPASEYISVPLSATAAVTCTATTTCTENEYQTTAPTTTSDRVCDELCNLNTHYVSTPHTTCTEYDTFDQVAIFVKNTTKPAFFGVKDTFAAALLATSQPLAPSIADIRIVTYNPPSNSSYGNGTLEVRVVALYANFSVIAPDILITALANRELDTSCYPGEMYECSCTSMDRSGDYFVGLTGCVTLSTSECFVRGGTNCSTATLYDHSTFGNPAPTPVSNASTVDPAYKPCPSDYPYFPSCLEYELDVELHSYSIAVAYQTLEYEVTTSITSMFNQSYGATAVSALKTLADTWRDIITPQPFPLEEIAYQIQYSRNNNGSLDNDSIQDALIEFAAPILGLTVFSWTMALIVPLAMCCICCCRSCRCCLCHKTCGGKMVHESPSQNARTTFLILTAVLAVLLGLVAFGLISADSQLESGLDDTKEAVIEGVVDIERFKNQTLDQALLVANTLVTSAATRILDLVDLLSSDAATSVQTIVTGGSAALFDALDSLASQADSITFNLESLANDTTSVRSDLITLSNSTDELNANTSSAHTSCLSIEGTLSGAAQSSMNSICSAFPPALAAVFDVGIVPDLQPHVAALKALIALNVSAQLSEGQAFLADLADFVVNETARFQSDLNLRVDEFTELFDNATEDFRRDIEDAYSGSFSVKNISRDIEDAFDDAMFKEVRTRKTQANLAIGVLYVLLAVFILVALYNGMAGYRDVELTKRTTQSDFGGRLLKYIAIMTVILCVIINLLCGFLWLFSTMSGKTCDIFVEEALWNKVVDNPAIYDGEYPLAKAILNNGSLSLKVSDVLHGCRANEGLWSVLQLDQRINLTKELDLEERFNLTAQLSVLEIDFTDIISIDTSTIVDDLNQANFANVDISSLYSQLGANITDAVMTTYCSVYDGLVSALDSHRSTHGTSAALDTLILDMTTLNSTCFALGELVAATESSLQNLETPVLAINASFSDMSDAVANVTTSLDSFVTLVANTAEGMLGVDHIRGLLIDEVEEFAAEVEDVIDNDLGKCKTLVGAYDNILDATCGEAQTGFDAWWMSIALLAFFNWPIMYLSLKLAKYFRRMDDCDDATGKPQDEWGKTMQRRRAQSLAAEAQGFQFGITTYQQEEMANPMFAGRGSQAPVTPPKRTSCASPPPSTAAPPPPELNLRTSMQMRQDTGTAGEDPQYLLPTVMNGPPPQYSPMTSPVSGSGFPPPQSTFSNQKVEMPSPRSMMNLNASRPSPSAASAMSVAAANALGGRSPSSSPSSYMPMTQSERAPPPYVPPPNDFEYENNSSRYMNDPVGNPRLPNAGFGRGYGQAEFSPHTALWSGNAYDDVGDATIPKDAHLL
eukprot:m.305189 g.305189  ORF g.305189 m.305189 type:complete len:1512 (-) comp17600_c0_seq1:212-4747(-)